MCIKVAKTGFVACLLFFSVARGQSEWEVTYSSLQICALKGTTVKIRCTYRYPSTINETATVVVKELWFTKRQGDEPVDLQTAAEYAGRVKYHSDGNQKTLTISRLRESDSAKYFFRFITNQPGGSVTGSPGVTLSVTGLQVEVTRPSPFAYPSWAVLKCRSTCRLPEQRYVWYKNEQEVGGDQRELRQYFSNADSVSCAVRGHEQFPSPPVCVLSSDCNRVTYTHRSMCALSGSSVDISCTYGSRTEVVSSLWFSPQRGRPPGPEDLREDSRYAGRVAVLGPERGRSVLRLTELRESDSAEYRFRFKGQWNEWKSALPGTSLTVTAVRAQVTRVTAVRQSHTEAELRCHSSCSPAAAASYVWFKNGERNPAQQASTYTDSFYPGDVVSCAFQGHEDYRSPPAYPSKLPSLFWSPPGEIAEGSSVNLTCRLDGNSSATTTLYRGRHTLPLGPDGSYHFASIRSDDRGLYHCRTEEQHNASLFIDVQYGPKRPSVSVSPSGEIMEGSSVTLTCSSDANPAANYTWYKEGEDSPAASGQTFNISNFTPEHSGNYYCEAENSRGRQTSRQLRLIGGADDSLMLPVALAVSAVCLVLVLLCLSLSFRREKSGKQESVVGEAPCDLGQGEELHYATIQFATPHEDTVYSNFSPNWLRRFEEERVIYSTPKCLSAAGGSCEDVTALYAKVNKGSRE